VSVSDNGPGIADLEKSKSVERFYRGDASRGIPGVGLGLSLVQAVAKLHGSALALSDQSLPPPSPQASEPGSVVVPGGFAPS